MLNWKLLQEEYEQLNVRLAEPSLDQKTRVGFQKRASLLSTILELNHQTEELNTSIAQNTQESEKESGELKELYLAEIEECQAKKIDIERQLEDILYPSDPRDSKSVFLEIRAGAGGQE